MKKEREEINRRKVAGRGNTNIWYLHVVNQLLRAGHIAADGAKALGKGAHHDIDIGRVHALERTRRDEPSMLWSVENQRRY